MSKHTLIFGYDTQLVKWACERIPWMEPSPAMKAVGVSDGDSADAKLLAVCVYHNYLPPRTVLGETWYNTCELSFAAASPRFATRRVIVELLKVPFDQFKVDQVLVAIPSINERAVTFVKGLGFTPRGTVSRFFSPSVHACVFGLHRNTFKSPRFLRGKRPAENRRPHGQEHSVVHAAAASA